MPSRVNRRPLLPDLVEASPAKTSRSQASWRTGIEELPSTQQVARGREVGSAGLLHVTRQRRTLSKWGNAMIGFGEQAGPRSPDVRSSWPYRGTEEPGEA